MKLLDFTNKRFSMEMSNLDQFNNAVEKLKYI